jgi:hypothetical protein
MYSWRRVVDLSVSLLLHLDLHGRAMLAVSARHNHQIAALEPVLSVHQSSRGW